MSSTLTYRSTIEDVARSLQESIDEVKEHGETVQLKFDVQLKLGRLLLLNNQPEDAKIVFQRCGMMAVEAGVPDIRDLWFWSARCQEELENPELSVNVYLALLKNKHFVENNREYVDVILERLSNFGDATQLLDDFSKKQEEEMKNPKDLLGKVRKFLREEIPAEE